MLGEGNFDLQKAFDTLDHTFLLQKNGMYWF